MLPSIPLSSSRERQIGICLPRERAMVEHIQGVEELDLRSFSLDER